MIRKREREIVRASTRAAWRKWLERHHEDKAEIWLVFAKKASGKRSVSYDQAVEEALCFGWIDTTVNRLSEEEFIQRFTPRTGLRNWSTLNLERFRKLEDAGLMTDAGRAKLPEGIAPPAPRVQTHDPVPEFIVRALARHPRAAAFFNGLAPGYRRDYVRWITEARREDTRERRLAEAVRLLEGGEKRVQNPSRKKR